MVSSSFAGKVVVVTGAASGIGAALAAALSAAGARLALSDVDETGLAATAALCPGARGYPVDVADRDAVRTNAKQVAADFGRVDVVVNNAGVTLVAPVVNLDPADLEWVMDVNFMGVVHGTTAFLPYLTESRGHLVNVSSVYGLRAAPYQSAYNAAKFAIRAFTEALRMELAMERVPVRVTLVHPGRTRTNIMRNARTDSVRDYTGLADDFANTARLTPERAARAILRGVARDRPRVLVGRDARLADLAARVRR